MEFNTPTIHVDQGFHWPHYDLQAVGFTGRSFGGGPIALPLTAGKRYCCLKPMGGSILKAQSSNGQRGQVARRGRYCQQSAAVL